MKAFWLLTRLRMAEVTRVTSSALFFFGFPLVMLLVVCTLFAGGHPFEQVRVGVVGRPDAVLAVLSEAQARWEGVASEDEARVRLGTGQLNAAVVEEPGGWLVLVTPRQHLLGEGLRVLLPASARLQAVEARPWGYVHFLCPGLLAFSVILSGLYGLGYSMARYRQSQFLRKLATTPLSKWTFLASQIAGRGLLVLVQCTLLLTVMVTALQLPLGPVQALLVLMLCALGLAVFLGAGLLLACVVSNEGVLSDAINALAWPIVLGSGIFFPIDVLPAPLAAFVQHLPSTQLVSALRDVMLYGQTPTPATLLVLLGWSAVTFLLGGRLFDWIEE